MKKAILLIIILIFLTGCGMFDLGGFITPDDVEFIACVKELDTPQKISNYMILNFTYEAHIFYTPDPYTLWKTGLGDCDDMAIFGAYAAYVNNIEVYNIRIFYSGTIVKHRIAIYVEDDGLSFTDNQDYFNNYGYFFSTFREIVKYDNTLKNDKSWSKYIVYNYDMNIVEQGHNN